jgi:hypothetical protein
MDLSRSIKRLAIILVVAIIVILVSKSLLSKTVKNLAIEAEKKQQANIAKLRATLPASAPTQELSISPEPADRRETLIQPAPLSIENSAATQ